MKRKKNKSKDHFTASNGVMFEFVPDATSGKPFSQAELKRAKSLSKKAAEITPELLEAASELKQARGRGRPKSENPKQPISFRFSADLVQHLKNDVAHYNIRVEHLLHRAMIEGRL